MPAGSSARLFRDEGAFDPPDDSARVWGGFALGCVFALIGLVMGLTAGWQATAIGLLVGGICMIGIQWIWSWRRRRRGLERSRVRRVLPPSHTRRSCSSGCTRGGADP